MLPRLPYHALPRGMPALSSGQDSRLSPRPHAASSIGAEPREPSDGACASPFAAARAGNQRVAFGVWQIDRRGPTRASRVGPETQPSPLV